MRFKLECYELQELMKIKYGKNQKKVEDENGEFPILGTGGVMGYANKFLYDKPSVLIGRKGSISKVKYIDKPFWTVDTLFYTEINENKALPLYIYYYLSQIDFNYYNEGTTIPSLRTETLNKIEIYLPNIKVQKKIVDFLLNIDGKIELNSKIILNLEQLSQTLFKHWFIDFEFPNEEGNPYKSNGGEMVVSELGEIPATWNLGEINSLGSIIGGGTPSKKNEEYYTSEGISWITPKDLSNNKNIFIYKGAIDITELGLQKGSARMLPENTVLFSSRAPIGYIAIAGQPVTTNQGFKSIIPDKGYSYYFIYHMLKYATPAIEAAAGGTTFKEISGKGLKEINTILPSHTIVEKFHDLVTPFFLQIQVLEKENQDLKQLRDTLLPKLLSGEIEIPDELEV